MKTWLILILAALLATSMFLACNSDDGDDDDCSCEESADDSDQGDDDDSDEDETQDEDQDGLGASPGAEQCQQDLKPIFDACSAPCYENEEMCDFYHCLYGCFADLFQGALDCADQYPELEYMVDYWQCHLGCDQVYTQCLEPLDQCDFDVLLICTDESQNCEAGCVVETAPESE